MLESQLHDRSVCKYTVPSTHDVVDQQVEMRKSLDDLMTSQSIEGRRDFPDFEMLDAGIASALRKIIINSSFKRRVSVEEQRAQKTKSILERKTDCVHDL